jgi:ankyrin repeat protein
MRSGNELAASKLRELGCAVDSLRPIDAFLHACAIGDEHGARQALAEDPSVQEELRATEYHAMIQAVQTGNTAAVRVLASLGFDLSREGPWGGTALHWAAWHGLVDVVRELLAVGAPIQIRDKTYGSTPLAWAAHGSNNCREADDDYIAIIDLLLQAGSERAPSYNHWNEPPENLASDAVADHLRARGFVPER